MRKKKFLIGGFVVLIALSYLAYSGFASSATYYFTVSELAAQKESAYGQKLRVSGMVADEAAVESSGLILRFTMVEQGTSLPVIYRGAVPDTFKVGSGVTVEGSLGADGVFQADNILTKCPSKYVAEE